MHTKVLQIYNLLKIGRNADALQLAKNHYTTQNNSNNFELIKVLAICYMQNQINQDAYKFFLIADQLKKNDFEVITNLASLSLDQYEYIECLKYSNQSISIKKHQHMAYFTLSKLYHKSREYNLSLDYILKAIQYLGGDLKKIHATHEDIVTFYFDILIALGEKNKVLSLIDEIEKHVGFTIQKFHFKVRTLVETLSSKDIEKASLFLKNFLQEMNNKRLGGHFSTKLEYAHFLFDFGKYYLKEDVKVSDNFFIEANKIIASIQRFKPLDHQKKTITLLNNYLKIKDLSVSNQKKGDGLIFITGLPRSGTTLLESILASNDETFAGDELEILKHSIPNNFYNNPCLSDLEDVGDNYLSKIQFLKKDKNFFIDKLPDNCELIGLISKALPGAKIIFMQRDIWEVAISQFQQYYFRNVPYTSSFFSIGLVAANTEELLRVYTKYVSSNILMKLDYEALVSDPDNIIPELYGFCKISSKYEAQKRASHVSSTASVTQVRGEIHTKSIKKDSFGSYKEEFLKNIDMQRKFWVKNSPEINNF